MTREPLWLRIVGWTAVVWAVAVLALMLVMFSVFALALSALELALTGWVILGKWVVDCVEELMEQSK